MMRSENIKVKVPKIKKKKERKNREEKMFISFVWVSAMTG
jgi:hypothetical protein